MPLAAVALGSNLGDRERTLNRALRDLRALGTVTAASTFLDTEPVGYLDQPRFLNAAALLETALSPVALLHGLLGIEREHGRDRSQGIAKGPRTLDLDLLLYDDLVLATSELVLPHPEMHLRGFVLQPLAEIAPDGFTPRGTLRFSNCSTGCLPFLSFDAPLYLRAGVPHGCLGAVVSKKKDKAEEAEAQEKSADARAMLMISRALADPRRVEVFRRIASAEATACMQLRECLAMNPATLSHHMKQLEASGLIETVRDGKFVRANVRRKVWKGYLAYLKSLAA